MPKYGNKQRFVTAENADKARLRFKELGWKIPDDFHEVSEMDKCKECPRYDKCRQIVEVAKERNLPLLALGALRLCPKKKGGMTWYI